LQWCIRANAPNRAELPARGVEVHHRWMQGGPPDEGVDPSPKAIFSLALLPLLVVVRQVPDTGRLRWKHTRSADLAAEDAARGKRNIANRLRGEPETCPARNQPVVGIGL